MLKYGRIFAAGLADKLGLIFIAMAGYNARVAPAFWKRMASDSEGRAPLEFMSSHPSHVTSIKDLEAQMTEATKYYKP